MVDRPTLHEAVAGTKSKASDYNENFTKLMKYVEDSIDESETYIDTKVAELDEIAEEMATTMHVTTTAGVPPIDSAGTYRYDPNVSGGLQQTLYELEVGANTYLYAKVGNTNHNGNWLLYNAGDYYKKETYSGDDKIETEYGGYIYLNVTMATWEQTLNFVLPKDIDWSNFSGQFKVSPPYVKNDGSTISEDIYSVGQELTYISNKFDYANDGVAVANLKIPKASSTTDYYCQLNWCAKQTRLFDEAEEE